MRHSVTETIFLLVKHAGINKNCISYTSSLSTVRYSTAQFNMFLVIHLNMLQGEGGERQLFFCTIIARPSTLGLWRVGLSSSRLTDSEERLISSISKLDEEAATQFSIGSDIVINNIMPGPRIHSKSVYYAVLYRASMVGSAGPRQPSSVHLSFSSLPTASHAEQADSEELVDNISLWLAINSCVDNLINQCAVSHKSLVTQKLVVESLHE